MIAALEASSRLGMVDAKPVVARLADSNAPVRRAALRAFCRLPVVDTAHLPKLMDLARSRDDPVRVQAILAMAALGTKAEPAASLLREALASKDRRVADAAVRAVEAMGQSASHAAPGLIDYIRNNGACNKACVRLLSRFGDARVASDLLDIARRDHIRSSGLASTQTRRIDLTTLPALIRFKHVHALGRFGPAAAPAVPMLIDVLENGRPFGRIGAAQTLAAIGPKAGFAADALRGALDDPSPEVRDEARRANVAIESGKK